jgi:excisionase family DNA binding protein
MVKKIRMDQYYGLVIPCETGTDGQPTGYKFSLVSSSGKDLGVTDTIIKRWETRMQYQFMTEYMSLGMDRVGSLATSSDKTGMLANSISAIADGIEDVINKDAIPRLMELNGFPVEACPRIKHGDIEKKSIQETFSAVVQGVSSGAMQADASVENMLRDMVDLEPRDTGLELPGLGDALQPPTQEIATEPVQDAAPVEPPPQSLTVGQASELIGAGPNVIRAAIRAGQLPGARVGGQYRVMRDDLMAYMRGAHGQSIRQPE